MVVSNRKQLKLVVVKMHFIIKMQDVPWNPGREMQLASGWPETRNWGAGKFWFVLDIS